MKSIHFLTFCIIQLFSPFPLVQASSTVPTSTASPSDPLSYTSLSHFQTSILNSTNTYRSQHNASALTWNTTLAAYADTYTNHCIWAHSVPSSPFHFPTKLRKKTNTSQHGPYGENLAATYPSASAAINSWGDERASFDFQRPSFTERTGHFSQLVWKDTLSVGCGRTRCHGKNGVNGWFVVCEYWPGGNVAGGFRANVQSRVGGQIGDGGGEGFIGKSGAGRGRGVRMGWWVGAAVVGVVLRGW